MKKILILLGALLAFSGCQKDVSTDTYKEEIVVEEAVVEETQEEVKEEPIIVKSATIPYEPGEGIITEKGPLQVLNGQLSTANGLAIQLKGLSTHGLQWYGSFITDKLVSKFASEWKIDILRAAMYVEEDGYTTNYKSYNLMNLEKSIAVATQNGIYVIVDWHVHADKDPMLHIEESKEFFTKIAEKYADHENIIYEICNEPNGNITWEGNIKPYAEVIIPIIRQYDEDAVIIVGTPSWSQELDKAADNPLDFDNILYTMHFYAGTHGQELRDVATYAMDKGIGIFVTEWGTSKSSGGGGVFTEESDVWLDFLDEHNISWCNWAIADKAESSALFLPNFNPEADWTDDSLSESGLYVKSKLLD